MSKKLFYNSIFFFLFFSQFQSASAQQKGLLKASVDKNKVLIGQPFQFRLEARILPGQNISLPRIDSIHHFEIRKKGQPLDSMINGQKILVQEYLLASFDSGHWVIPRYKIGRLYTDSIPMDIVFSDFDPSKDYHDIKEIIEVEDTNRKKVPWWLFVAGIFFLGIFLWQLIKRKPKAIEAIPVRVIDAYKEAMAGLEKLNRPDISRVEFYSGLINVFRLYIFRKKGILSLQKTTDELVLQLKPLVRDQENFISLSQALQLSDFVKFAKYTPASGEDQATYDTIRKAIISIENETVRIEPTK